MEKTDTALSRTIRNTNIEILRFLLLCSIFIWHLIVHGLDFKDIGQAPYQYNIHVTIRAVVLLSPAVNCFMFISGWFGMKLKVKKLLSLSIVCMLTSCICTVINRSGILQLSGGGRKELGYTYFLFPLNYGGL